MERVSFDTLTLLQHGVNRTRLARSIGQVQKWKSDDSGHWANVPLYTPYDQYLGKTDVFLRSKGGRRLYVRCPICESWIAVGQLRKHVGSKRCDDIFLGEISVKNLIIDCEIQNLI